MIMTNSSEETAIGRITVISQLIDGAIIAPALILVAVASLLDLGITNLVVPLTYIAVAVAIPLVIASVLIPRLIAARQRRSIADGTWVAPQGGNRPNAGTPAESLDTDIGKLATVYLTQFIVGVSTISGAANFAGIAYLLEKNPIAVALALAIIFLLILRFPTRRRVELWIEEQQEKLNLERQARS